MLIVLDEDQVHYFNFYLQSAIRRGMRYGDKLYGLAYAFDKHCRRDAYRFAHDLTELDTSVVMTVTEQGYDVWLCLHASEYPHWQTMNQAALISA